VHHRNFRFYRHLLPLLCPVNLAVAGFIHQAINMLDSNVSALATSEAWLPEAPLVRDIYSIIFK